MTEAIIEPSPDRLPREWKNRIKRMSEYQRENSSDWESNERLLVGDTTGVVAVGLKDSTGNQAKGHAYAWGGSSLLVVILLIILLIWLL